MSSRPPIFPRTKGPGLENGASRDPGTKARAVTSGSRVAAFCFQIKDLDKNRPRDDKVGVSWMVMTFFKWKVILTMRIFLIALFLGLIPAVVLAETQNSAPKQIGKAETQNSAPKQIGKYGEWTAFVMTQNGNKVCYMASFPKQSEGKYTKRGEVYALVTHRPRDNNFNVVSLQAGYSFASGATVIPTIDGKQHKLFTESETAWAPSGSDKDLTTAMSRGKKMIVVGTSSRGTKTEDIYSLEGSLPALRAINKACGAK